MPSPPAAPPPDDLPRRSGEIPADDRSSSGADDESRPAPTLASPADAATVDFAANRSRTAPPPGDGSQDETRDDPSVRRGAPGAAPRRLGDYELLGELGRGGMGVVYRARHGKLGRVVALKMVLAGAHASPEQLARFLSEARAVAHLQHPHIAQIFEIGEHEGLPYFALEYVDGPTLARRLARRPQRPEDAASLVATLARAMHYAHSHGVLHRDLKPGNILLAGDDVPKIVDFGLAKNVSDEETESQTRTGTILGTPSYMAPEQARGEIKAITAASDQYALGAILYEMLVGRAPFVSPNPLDTVLQVIEDEPVRPTELQPKLPLDVETICLKCLHKDPSRRYASCAELADDLERFVRQEPIVARPVGALERAVRWCRRNRLAAGLGASVLVALAAVAGVSTWSAYEFSVKNAELKKLNGEKDQATRRANQKADEARRQQGIAEQQTAYAREQEGQAKENARRAEEQAQIAQANARELSQYVRTFFELMQRFEPEESPRVRPLRDALLFGSLDAMKAVVPQLPKSGDAEPVYAGVLLRLADGLAAAERIEEADKFYLEVGEIFERRLPLKQHSDAARSNLANQLGQLGNLRRDFHRDLRESLALHRRAVDLAQEVVDAPKVDDQGQGRVPPFLAKLRLAHARSNLAATLYRLGDARQAAEHFAAAAALRQPLLDDFDRDPDIATMEKGRPGFKAEFRKELTAAIHRGVLATAAARFRTGDVEAAEPLFRQAHEQTTAAARQDPASLSARHALVGVQGFRAEALAQSGKTDEALPLLEDCVRLADELALQDPSGATFGRSVALAHYRLAAWRTELGRDDAAAPLERCRKIRESLARKAPGNDRRQLDWMLVLARAGDPQQADELAVRFRGAPTADAELLVEVARAWSQLGRRAADADRERHLERAVDALRHAVRLGFRDRLYFEYELDLKPLRERADFRELLASIP